MSVTDKLSVVNNRYKLAHQIGAGTFGDIFLGMDLKTEQPVCLKIEDNKNYVGEEYLKKEAKFLTNLAGGLGVPSLKWFGQDEDYNILVTDFLGPNLEHLYDKCGRQFSLKTVLSIADQLLTRIEFLHENNIIHRDLKPENFCIGLKEKSDQIYMIDLGIAKKFRDPRTRMHIPFQQNQELAGSTRFSSISAHFGIEQSRRDDLESIGYMLIYFLRGDLPWKRQWKAGESVPEQLENIRNAKLNTNEQELCQGKPQEFSQYMQYVKNLKFEEKPDYNFLKTMFRDLFQKHFDRQDWVFDWAVHQ